MNVKELISQLLEEDMHKDVFIRVGKEGMPIDGISSLGKSFYDVCIEPERELKDAEEAERFWYARTSLAPEAYKNDRCAADVPYGWRSRQCSRPNGHGPSGLYCKQHARKVKG